MKPNVQSCVHIYCGNGKGKTSTGMGLCLRAAGHGKRVLIYQFLKNNSTGETASLALLPTVTRLNGRDGVKFSFEMSPSEREQACQEYCALLHMLAQTASSYDLLFLDEAIYAIAAGLLDENDLIHFIKNRPPHLEVILTGQKPSAHLIAAADYVSEICKIKHPFDDGQPSRQGIEW